MDAQVLTTEDIMKIEMEGVGFQAVETDTKPFELYDASWNLCFKCDTNKDSKNAVSDRGPVPEIIDQMNIKHEPDDYFVDDLASRTAICLWITKEHNYAKAWIKSEPEEELKVESCLDSSEKYSVLEIMEEFIIKDECNDDMFLDANPETASNRSGSECNVTNSQNLTATGERRKMKELLIKNKKTKHSRNTYTHQLNEKANVDLLPKSALKQKTIVKQQSVACKKLSRNLVYCNSCNYSARSKYILVSHMTEHRDLKKHKNEQRSSYKHITCIHCNTKFRSKRSLDGHVLKQHSDLVASVSSKTHKCSHCAYKTTNQGSYRKHMLKHSKTASKYKFGICTHCNAKFKSKWTLYEHIIREHPDFISSLSCKLYHCTRCTYKTTFNSGLAKHMFFKHSESVGNYKFFICVHCTAKFKYKYMLDNHIVKEHPDFIASVSAKIHECKHCEYKTTMETSWNRHMLVHSETVDNYKFNICIHCNAKFKFKHMLDNHIIKEHPDFISSVSAKIHECKHCEYKTTMKNCLASHVWKHPETVDNYKFIVCIHCNVKFKFKHMLDNHIIKEHPGFIASITARIYECKHCEYKTTMKTGLARHMLKHRETVENYKFRICIHCEAKCKTIAALNDHLVQKHPDFTASVSSKIHECTHCAYRTTQKKKIDGHMSKHSKLVDNYKFRICIHCNAKLKGTRTLNDHIVRRHPEFIASVSAKIHECTCCAYKTVIKSHLVTHMKNQHLTCRRKAGLNDDIVKKHPECIASVSAIIHECTHCAYKTTIKAQFFEHMLKHPETVDDFKFLICIQCKVTFKDKSGLDDHLIKKHPDLIASVSSKILECEHCEYKTIFKNALTIHMKQHPEAKGYSKFDICVHCSAEFKSKTGLNYHIIKKHPDFIPSVSSKIYECAHCAFKTLSKSHFTAHKKTKHRRNRRCQL